jgi:capsid protein
MIVGLLKKPTAETNMYAVRWSSPRIPSADENTEVSTAILKMQAGLESRPAIMEAFGIDPDVETAAIAADNAKLDELGILSSGNLAAVTLAGQAQQPPAGTTTTETTD